MKNIFKKRNDFAYIKQAIRGIYSHYLGLFEMKYEKLYDEFIKDAPLAVFAVLMHKEMRQIFLANKIINENLQFVYRNQDILKAIEDSLKMEGKETDDYWDDLEKKGNRFMIISMEQGNYVRNQGQTGMKLGADEINGKFVFLDGIDYMSNNKDNVLIYMEVEEINDASGN